jgi:hypothetical protein
VLDPIVLDLLFTVRREEFVPAAHRALASRTSRSAGRRRGDVGAKLEARCCRSSSCAPASRSWRSGRAAATSQRCWQPGGPRDQCRDPRTARAGRARLRGRVSTTWRSSPATARAGGKATRRDRADRPTPVLTTRSSGSSIPAAACSRSSATRRR